MAKRNSNNIHLANIYTAWDMLYSYSNILPNPDQVLRKNDNDIAIYEQLLSDGYLKGALSSRYSGVTSREWRLESGDVPKRFFKAYSKWFDKNIDFRFKSEFVQVLYWGYMPHELYSWEPIDGWLFPRFRAKPPKWFFYGIDQNGNPELRFKSKNNYLYGETIPPFKMITPSVFSSYENPYGESLASVCFWPIVLKRGGLEFFSTFLEKYGSPQLKHTLGEGVNLNDSKKQARADLIADMVQDGVVVLEHGEDISGIDDKASGRTQGYQDFISYQDKVMAVAILNHSLALDTPQVGSGGSYAATNAAMEGPRADLVEQDVNVMMGFFNSIATSIKAFNGLSTSTKGPYHLPYEKNALFRNVAERDSVLYSMGWRPKAEYFIDTFGFASEHFYVDHGNGEVDEPEDIGDSDPGKVLPDKEEKMLDDEKGGDDGDGSDGEKDGFKFIYDTDGNEL